MSFWNVYFHVGIKLTNATKFINRNIIWSNIGVHLKHELKRPIFWQGPWMKVSSRMNLSFIWYLTFVDIPYLYCYFGNVAFQENEQTYALFTALKNEECMTVIKENILFYLLRLSTIRFVKSNVKYIYCSFMGFPY